MTAVVVCGRTTRFLQNGVVQSERGKEGQGERLSASERAEQRRGEEGGKKIAGHKVLTRARCQVEAASRGGSEPHGGTSLLLLLVLGSPGGRSHDDSSSNGCQKQIKKMKKSVVSSVPHDMVLLQLLLGVVVVGGQWHTKRRVRACVSRTRLNALKKPSQCRQSTV